MNVQVRLKLTFPEALVREPILSRLLRQFPIDVNIRRADVRDGQGWMLCEVDGEPSAVDAGVEWLRQAGVQVDLLGDVLEG